MMGTASVANAGAIAREDRLRWLPSVVGFFFIFRVALVFLFFQADPVLATKLTVLAGVALTFCALFWTAGDQSRNEQAIAGTVLFRWIAMFLALSLTSVLWSGASSLIAALAYWVAMVADVVTVLLLIRHGEVLGTVEGILMGAVWGGVALALVGWCSPVTEDLRLGNDLFLHPNTLGLEIGFAALMAQYLARRGVMWRWLAIMLAITLLRTLSKTAILAFLIAESWYVLQSRHWTRAAKARIALAAAAIVACFWGLLSAYVDVYTTTGRGDQLETLTGRTVLWAETLVMGLERPWLGHGLYSFKSLIPTFGDFAPVHAHNELLQNFFEYGIVGVVIVIAIYVSLLQLATRAPKGELRTLTITLWIFAVVRGLTDAVVVELSYPLWLMVALAPCLSQRPGEEGAVQ